MYFASGITNQKKISQDDCEFMCIYMNDEGMRPANKRSDRNNLLVRNLHIFLRRQWQPSWMHT